MALLLVKNFRIEIYSKDNVFFNQKVKVSTVSKSFSQSFNQNPMYFLVSFSKVNVSLDK